MSTIYVVGTVVHWTAWTLAIIFMADFICGFVHWLEDNYGREDAPIIGAAIIAPNRRHHAHHHRGLRNSHYCSITNWVNPILDRSGFWRGLEFCIYKMTGVLPRVEVTQNQAATAAFPHQPEAPSGLRGRE